MSWLYTVVFAGLLFSSQGSAVSNAEHAVQNHPLFVESAIRDESEHFEHTYALNANGRLSLSNVNGSVIVEAWDRNEVKLEYTKTSDTKERLADVEIRIDSRPDYLSVETDYGDWKKDKGGWRSNNRLQVDFHLMVPRGAVLNEVETVNGSVTVSNFINFTKISAVNGGVNAVNLRGTANLSTVNGEVSADFDRLETGNKINLNTVNGSARIVIPSDSNATLKVDSLNGNITNDFGLPVRKGKYVGRDLYGKIGTGDVMIRLSSVNGPLTISRRNDGKTLSPATNLLPQKKDDDDWDNDNGEDATVDYEKLNKDIAKSVKAAEKQIRIDPEIAKVTAESIKSAVKAVEQTAALFQSDEFKAKVNAAVKLKDMTVKIAPIAFMSSVPRVEKKSDSFPVKGVPKVTVDAKGCSVAVKGWDKSEVQYRVVQFSDARHPSPLNITEDHNDGGVNIRIQNPDADAHKGNFFEGAPNVRIEVYVPRKSNLKINADGGIRLEGVSGNVELTGNDESINVRDVDGTLHVSSSDGRIRVIGFKGEIVAESSAGMVNLEGDFLRLTARADEGAITLTVPESLQANLDATCDQIRGEGISVTRTGGDEKLSHYRIGSGGPLFRIETSGEIRVRSSSLLMAGM